MAHVFVEAARPAIDLDAPALEAILHFAVDNGLAIPKRTATHMPLLISRPL